MNNNNPINMCDPSTQIISDGRGTDFTTSESTLLSLLQQVNSEVPFTVRLNVVLANASESDSITTMQVFGQLRGVVDVAVFPVRNNYDSQTALHSILKHF